MFSLFQVCRSLTDLEVNRNSFDDGCRPISSSNKLVITGTRFGICCRKASLCPSGCLCLTPQMPIEPYQFIDTIPKMSCQRTGKNRTLFFCRLCALVVFIPRFLFLNTFLKCQSHFWSSFPSCFQSCNWCRFLLQA